MCETGAKRCERIPRLNDNRSGTVRRNNDKSFHGLGMASLFSESLKSPYNDSRVE